MTAQKCGIDYEREKSAILIPFCEIKKKIWTTKHKLTLFHSYH